MAKPARTDDDATHLVWALKSRLVRYCHTREDIEALANHAFAPESWTKWESRARDDGHDDVIAWMRWLPEEAVRLQIDGEIKKLLDPIFFNANGSPRTEAEIATAIDVFHQQQFHAEHLAARQQLEEMKARFASSRANLP